MKRPVYVDMNISEKLSYSVFNILYPEEGVRDFTRNFVNRLHCLQTIKVQIC